jgi:transcriptional regulator with XRE-family HTH domain
MNLDENISNNIQRLRKERNVTQDVLAAALEISVQAISKWETGASLPDIMQLPRIAKFFGISIDYLFYNEGSSQPESDFGLPEDDKLRIIQFRGNKILGKDLWDKNKSINMKIPDEYNNGNQKTELNVEIWGNANIDGDVNGNADCGGGLECGNIGGYADCGGGINCGNIGGYAECGGGLNCGNIGGNADCGGGLNCGNINGNAECGGDLSCGDIGGNADCEGNIRCKEIKGGVQCEGDIIYEKYR